MKVSPFDLMSAIIRGGKVDPSNVSSSGSGVEVASIVLDNKEFVMILTTSIAVLIGCVVVFILRRSSSSKPKKLEPLKPLVVKEPEVEVDDGKQKVTIFFGTQTGTAEGFAKALADEARARYDKAIFKVVDIVSSTLSLSLSNLIFDIINFYYFIYFLIFLNIYK